MSIFKKICSVFLIVALVATVFIAAVYSGTSAESPEFPAYNISVSSLGVKEGSTENAINLSLTGSGAYGLQATISYDSNILEAKNVALLIDETQYNAVYNVTYDTGKIFVMVYAAKSIPEGKVLQINFDAKASTAHQNTAITLGDVVLSDSTASEVPAEEITITNGEVNIFPSSVTTVLKVESYSLAISSNVTLQAKVDAAVLDEYTDVYMLFKISNRGEKKVYPEKNKDSNGRLVFRFDNINPYEYLQNITMKVCGELDKVEYCSAQKTYSVLQYCANQFKSGSSTETFKKVLANLLNYGAYGQAYVEATGQVKDTGPLCTKDPRVASFVEQYVDKRDAKELNLADISTTKHKEIDNPTATWKSANLALGGAITVSVYFETEVSEENLVVNACYNGKVLRSYTGQDIKYDKSNKRYYVRFSDYGSQSMGTPMDFVVCDKDGNEISNTYRYSIESYVERMIIKEKSKDPNLNNLLLAMRKFGLAIEEYTKK